MLSPEVFGEICGDAASSATIQVLADSELSRRLLQLRAVLELSGRSGESFVDLRAAWRLIERAEQRSAEEVRTVLMTPAVGVWLRHVLHAAQRGGTRTAPPDLGYAHLVAASAALRTGVPFQLPVPVSHGCVVLPSLGWVRVRMSFPVALAELRSVPGGAELRVMRRSLDIPLCADSPHFTRVRPHAASSPLGELSLVLDDHDPYREFDGSRPPRPLGEAERAEWAKLIDAAWADLSELHPERARELAACINTISPLDPSSGTIGASSRGAFGAVAMSPAASPDALAEVLIHELQHNKLNALMNLVDLAADDGTLFHAPWRADPRPLPGLLHGVYSFAAVVEFWQRQRHARAGTERRQADFHFSHHREQLRRAMTSIDAAAGLTALGRGVVRAVGRRLAACEDVAVPTEIAGVTAMLCDEQQLSWRIRNVRPDEDVVRAATEAWSRREDPATARGGTVVAGTRWAGISARTGLLRLRVLDPEGFAHRASKPGPGTNDADVALVGGDPERALPGYARAAEADGGDHDPWVGIALAMREAGRLADESPLLTRPEIAVEVYRRVAALGGAPPSAIGFADWFAT